jgi:ATP-dependent metalloprotease
LNALLVEMDGFEQKDSIIVIGATNLPESLDSALKRAGRFDKEIHIPSPDVKGRKDIIELYLGKIFYD